MDPVAPVSAPTESPLSSLKIKDHFKTVAPDTSVDCTICTDGSVLIELNQIDTGQAEMLLRTSFTFDKEHARYFTFNLAKEMHKTSIKNLDKDFDSTIRYSPNTKALQAIKDRAEVWVKIKPIILDFFIARNYIWIFENSFELLFKAYMRFNPNLAEHTLLLRSILESIVCN